jgi:hypothetical protein
MSLPTTSGQTAVSADFNAIQSQIQDIRGISELGYGLTAVSPTVTGSLIATDRANTLLRNVGSVYTHITNLTTTTQAVTTTTTVSAGFYNQVKAMVDYCLTNRYTCHPSQFVHDGSGTLIYTASTSSTRTLPWGANGTTSITHRVQAVWATRLTALYYFNNGNYLTWIPSFEGSQINDLDIEWATWLNYIAATPSQQFKYDRSSFTSGSLVTRPYSSGTLRINVVATKSNLENAVDFTVTYQNVDAPLLIVTPAAWAYRIDL